MIAALGLAFSEIAAPRLRRVLARGLAIAAAVLAALLVGAALLLHGVLPGAGVMRAAIEVFGDVAMLTLAWVLFPVAVTTVLGFFVEGAIAAVEAERYPDLPTPRRQTMAGQLRSAMRLGLLGLVVNLLALPLYLVLPGLNLLLFYGLNGWLLGREYFELVALRRLDERQLRAFWRSFWPRLVAAGMVIALLLTVPLLNLAAPLIAALFMLHLFERLRRGANPAPLTS
ncbi:MAG TPA: EI24 domain-containing protein [Stellaceae bacterium]|nr:EI24 domain-containing protein [Stellaceae bacterium]